MKGLGKALGAFAVGTLLALALALGFKLLLVRALGERLYRLPSLQMERLARELAKKPVTAARVLVLGDSTATFSLETSKLRHADGFATVNTTTVENYYLLKRILDSGANPNCILASYSFQWELNRDFFWNMFVASGFYSDEELREIRRVRREVNEGDWLWGAREFAARQGWLDVFTVRRLQEVVFSWSWGASHVEMSRNLLHHRKGSVALRDANNFEGSLAMFFDKDPALTRTEQIYLKRTLELARDRGIPFIFLKVPFPASIAAERVTAYWLKYEQFLLDAAGPFRIIAPPPMPEASYISAGHLNQKGLDAMTPYVQNGLETCFR